MLVAIDSSGSSYSSGSGSNQDEDDTLSSSTDEVAPPLAKKAKGRGKGGKVIKKLQRKKVKKKKIKKYVPRVHEDSDDEQKPSSINLGVLVHVCERHNAPTTSTCAVSIEGTDGDVCDVEFCHMCLEDRYSILNRDRSTRLNAMAYLMCHKHFLDFCRSPSRIQEKITITYEAPLSIFHTISEKVSFNPPVSSFSHHIMHKIVDLSRDIRADGLLNSRHEPFIAGAITGGADQFSGHGNLPSLSTAVVLSKDDYSSIVHDCGFSICEILTEVTLEENLVPHNLPVSLIGGKKLRVTATNTAFLRNFFGLCVWKHMDQNIIWVKTRSLCLIKNPAKYKMFNGYVEYIRVNHPDIWMLVNSEGGPCANSLKSFCAKMRHQFLTDGTWNTTSENMNGVFEPFYNSLVNVAFPFTQ